MDLSESSILPMPSPKGFTPLRAVMTALPRAGEPKGEGL